MVLEGKVEYVSIMTAIEKRRKIPFKLPRLSGFDPTHPHANDVQRLVKPRSHGPDKIFLQPVKKTLGNVMKLGAQQIVLIRQVTLVPTLSCGALHLFFISTGQFSVINKPGCRPGHYGDT